MFCPCKCKGSLAHVHVDCLNQWRQTSANAYYTCPVCQYKYDIQKSKYAKILSSEYFVLLVTICLIFISTFVVGVLIYFTSKYAFRMDLVKWCLNILEMNVKWRNCKIMTRIHKRDLLEYQFYFENHADIGKMILDVCYDLKGNHYCADSLLNQSTTLSVMNKATMLAEYYVAHSYAFVLYYFNKYIGYYYVTGSILWNDVALYVSCQPVFLMIVECFFLGFVALGVAGLVLFLLERFGQVNQGDLMMRGRFDIANIVTFTVPLLSFLNFRNGLYIRILVGMIVSCTSVFNISLIKSRELVVSLGEIILEPR